MKRRWMVVLMSVVLTAFTGTAFADDEAKPAGSEAAHADDKDDKKDDDKKDDDKKDGDKKETEADKAAGEIVAKPGDPDPDDAPASNVKRTVKVGVLIQHLAKLDPQTGTFGTEVFIQMKCVTPATKCFAGIEFNNGRIAGKPDTVVNKEDYRVIKIKAELDSDLDYAQYPFDSQVLPFEIVASQSDIDDVTFEYDAETTKIDKNVKLSGWDIGALEGKVEKVLVQGTEVSVLTINVPITRPKAPVIFKNFLPVIFFSLVALLGLFIKAKSVINRLGMGTASLLATATFHISSTAALPPVGYLTRVDKFMMASYLLLIANIIASVLILFYDDKKNEAAVAKVHKTAMWLMPSLTLLAWVLILVVRI